MPELKPDTIVKLLRTYGLDREEARIYLYMIENGASTALNMSKELHIGRTKVYRILDKLNSKQLVQYQLNDRGLKFGASHPHKLEQLITEKINQAQNLKQELPDLLTHLNNLTQNAGSKSKEGQQHD